MVAFKVLGPIDLLANQSTNKGRKQNNGYSIKDCEYLFQPLIKTTRLIVVLLYTSLITFNNEEVLLISVLGYNSQKYMNFFNQPFLKLLVLVGIFPF